MRLEKDCWDELGFEKALTQILEHIEMGSSFIRAYGSC